MTRFESQKSSHRGSHYLSSASNLVKRCSKSETKRTRVCVSTICTSDAASPGDSSPCATADIKAAVALLASALAFIGGSVKRTTYGAG